MVTFAERLKSLRVKHSLTQEELASAISMSRSTIAGYEARSKQRQPDFQLVCRLAAFFGVSVDYLLGHTDEADSNGADTGALIEARRLSTLRKSRDWSRQNLACQLGVDVADIIRYETGSDKMPDAFMDRLAEVFDVDGRYFTGELSKETEEQVLGKTYFEAPAILSPEARQSVRDFIAFMAEKDKRRNK